MLSVYQAAYEGKLFIVKQMIEKDKGLVDSFDEVSGEREIRFYSLQKKITNFLFFKRTDELGFIGQHQEVMQIL